MTLPWYVTSKLSPSSRTRRRISLACSFSSRIPIARIQSPNMGTIVAILYHAGESICGREMEYRELQPYRSTEIAEARDPRRSRAIIWSPVKGIIQSFVNLEYPPPYHEGRESQYFASNYRAGHCAIDIEERLC